MKYILLGSFCNIEIISVVKVISKIRAPWIIVIITFAGTAYM